MQGELAKRMATIHAQVILDNVRQLDCPTKQKMELISAVQDLVRRDMNAQE